MICSLGLGVMLGRTMCVPPSASTDTLSALQRYVAADKDTKREIAIDFAESASAMRELIAILGAGARLKPVYPVELRLAALELIERTSLARDHVAATSISALFDPDVEVREQAQNMLATYDRFLHLSPAEDTE